MERTNQMFRYIISGGISVFVLIATLTTLHELLHIPVELSSATAYVASTICAFLLQKNWTWNRTHTTNIRREFFLYSTIALCGILINAGVMHGLIAAYKMWYIPAQFIAIATVVTGNFFLYDRFVFIQKD